MLRWATELGITDIIHEVSILSQYQSEPREGHMKYILHVFALLDGKPILTLYMDPDLPRMNYSVHKNDPSEFKKYYRDAEEEMPHNMQRQRGRSVVMSTFVNFSHGEKKSDKETTL